MLKLDQELENSFKAMGFPNYKAMDILPAHRNDPDGIVYIETLTTVLHPIDKTKFTATFVFGIAYPEDNTPYYIQRVYGMLMISAKQKQLPLADVEYGPRISKLPTKDEIIQKLFKNLNMHKVR